MRRAATAMWTIALFFAVVAAAGFAALDGIVARYTATLADGGTVWSQGVAILDTLTLKTVSDFLLGGILVIAALLLLVLRATRPSGFALLYIGLVHAISYAAADLSKPWFGRVRPFEAIQGGDVWFVGANSFPSGHVAFYAGLFFPLIVLFPRLAPLWAIPPLFVAAARVLEHDHYLSDVSVSLTVAAIVSALLCFMAERGRE